MPDAEAVSVLLGLLQVTVAAGPMFTVGGVVLDVTVADAVAVQPEVLVAVTVYVPPVVTRVVLPVTAISWVLKPINDTISVAPDDALILNLPSKSVDTLVFVPLTTTFAPGIGIPLEASVIIPFTVVVCA